MLQDAFRGNETGHEDGQIRCLLVDIMWLIGTNLTCTMWSEDPEGREVCLAARDGSQHSRRWTRRRCVMRAVIGAGVTVCTPH